MTDSLSAPERETIVTVSDADDLVRIWSAQRRHITRMRRNAQFTQIRTGFHGTTEWAEFTVPADRWSPVGVKRQVSLTEQQREQAAARLRAVRAS